MEKYFICLLIMVSISFSGYAQGNLTYQEPPQSIVELVDAPETPNVLFSSDGSLMLILEVPGYTTIEHVAQPVIGLAGLRINPRNNSTEAERSGIYTGIKVKEVKTGKERLLEGLPENIRIDNISWSPDGEKIAFSNNQLDGVELWVADMKTMKARRLTDGYLNDAFGETLQWHPNGQEILAQFIPTDRRLPPARSEVPVGPIPQENLGEIKPARTYQNLLKDSFDESLMDYYLISQLTSVDLQGNETKIGKPALYRDASYSPDGNYLMVQIVERPYSYIVPIYYFGYETSILNPDGSLIKTLFRAPLADDLPTGRGAVAIGPRSYEWRSDKPATIFWVEAQDEGDPAIDTDIRDALFRLNAPFTQNPEKVFSMELRYRGIDWINEDYAIVQERWRKDRRTKMSLIDPGSGNLVKVIADLSSEDSHKEPGRFVQGKGPYFDKVLLTDESDAPVVFTIGSGSSPMGDRPFLMKWNLLSNTQDTLFKSEAPYYEMPVFFNNDGAVYFSRESAEEAPNYVSTNLQNGKERRLTNFKDPYPSLQGVQKRLIKYSREDSLELSAMLYLPEGYKKEDGPLPVLIWAYPREYQSIGAAEQVSGSAHRYSRLGFRSPVYWVTRGYAVLNDAAMPIVGDEENEPNDTFISQLRQNAIALIDYVVDMGIADRKRIGIGGHSYGAFMVTNLFAHTDDLFAAGIARSGAYNRTLTPFGFQNEERTFWEAPELYGEMSPFFHADKIKTPLLLTHGMDDENSGTFPVQSERLYGAIKGHGGTVRLVLFPNEFHGFRSRESVLHTFWEQDQWLEKYVKNRNTAETTTEESSTAEFQD